MKLAGEPPEGLKSLLRPSHSAFFTLRGRHSVGEGLSSGEQRRQTTVRTRARSNPRRWIEELRDANGVKLRGASGRGPISSSPIIDCSGLVVEVLGVASWNTAALSGLLPRSLAYDEVVGGLSCGHDGHELGLANFCLCDSGCERLPNCREALDCDKCERSCGCSGAAAAPTTMRAPLWQTDAARRQQRRHKAPGRRAPPPRHERCACSPPC